MEKKERISFTIYLLLLVAAYLCIVYFLLKIPHHGGFFLLGIISLIFIIGIALLQQRERKKLKDNLESEHNHRLITIAGGLAHEIRNALNSMNFNLEILKESDLKDQQFKITSRITNEINALNTFLDSFLRFAKPMDIVWERFNIEKALLELYEFTKPELESSGIILQLDIPSKPLSLIGSSQILKQAIQNLLINAEQVLPPGGVVIIRLSESKGGILIIVQDNGPGIPSEHRKNIFDAFFTSRKEGTGLGLAIVKRSVEAMGGQIDFKTSSDGTTFYIFFPYSIQKTLERKLNEQTFS